MRKILPWAPLALLVAASLCAADFAPPTYAKKESVLPQAMRSYVLALKTNGPRKIQISGNGHTNLGVYVFDSNGNCVALDDGTAPQSCDEILVGWIPVATGRYSAVVCNGGFDVNIYQMAIR